MSATVSHRLVPIRPSPAKGFLSNAKSITIGITTTTSPSTLTPPRTGIKRKLEDPCSENVKCKRKINFGVNYVATSPQPAAVARRNARERNRVKQVNNGFATLRQHIPGASKAKKISKVDTLKQAVDYIRNLQDLLDEHDRIMNTTSMSSPHLPPTPTVTFSSYEYNNSSNITTITTADLQQLAQDQKVSYQNVYYGENISPVCSSVYPLSRSSQSSALSPACSDGTTASPSPSYLSDTSSQISCQETQPQTILPDEHFSSHNFPFADTYGGTFDLYSTTAVPNLEEDDVLEAIASWQKSK